MKKLILSLDVHDDKGKQKAMKAVSGLTGVDSISIDIKEKKLTVIGDVDPVVVVSKLRKVFHTNIISVGPAKEPEKKKEEPAKKDEGKKEGEGNKKDDKKTQEEKISELVNAYRAYNPYYTTHYHVRSMEENPNACVIC